MHFFDKERSLDSEKVFRTKNFNMPLQRTKEGRYKIAPGSEIEVGLSSDFFIEEADPWRKEAWKIIRKRSDIVFSLLTKRAERIENNLPEDWGEGYENVRISVSVENGKRALERMPLLLSLPCRHKGVMAAPLIGEVDLSDYLACGAIERVLCDGERYEGARPCSYEWVKSLSEQCKKYGVNFTFFATGSFFVVKGKTYNVADKKEQRLWAEKCSLDVQGRKIEFKLRDCEPLLF